MAEKKAKDAATTTKKPAAKKAAVAATPKAASKTASAKPKAASTASKSKLTATKTAAKPAAKPTAKPATTTKAAAAPKAKAVSAVKKTAVATPAVKTAAKIITESQLRRASKKEYMNEDQLLFFFNLLKQQKEETYEHVEMVRQELLNSERETDLIDRAALEDDRALKLRIVDREIKLLRKIDEALVRIRDGSYGYCDVTGEPIGIERLLLRPTATLSIEAKEIAEDKEKHFADEDRS